VVDDKTKYEEAGRFHRYILNWRQAALAGFLVAMFAVGNLLISLTKDCQYLVAAIIAFLSALLGFGFFVIDRRNRQIYNGAAQAARALEASGNGPYTRVHTLETGNNPEGEDKLGPHTITLWCIYWGSTVVLLVVCGVLFYLRYGKS